MNNKTCGECKWFVLNSEGRCFSNEGVENANNDCCSFFEAKIITNGDRINTESKDMSEVWARIPEYPNYFISTLGRVKSVDPRWRTPRILKPKSNGTGYMQIQLTVGGKHTTVYVHRLVASTFIPNQENKPCVDHIDGNPSNNCISNLRWCTPKENRNFPMTSERCAKGVSKSLIGKLGRNARKSKPIRCVETDKIYWGTLEAQRETGVCATNITKVLHRKRQTAGGFLWEYVSAYNMDNKEVGC